MSNDEWRMMNDEWRMTNDELWNSIHFNKCKIEKFHPQNPQSEFNYVSTAICPLPTTDSHQ